MRRVIILDTSILCCWLSVAGKETCCSGKNEIDRKSVESILSKEEENGAAFVLPLATIIETGNHIAHSSDRRYETAKSLGELMKNAADNISPWAAFTQQTELWSDDELRRLADEWPKEAAKGISLADITITKIADYYASMGASVHILSGDGHLKNYQPKGSTLKPRRR